jgi:hypothetical protein
VFRAPSFRIASARWLSNPWADAHPQGALLVGISLADEAENFALPLGQWFPPGGRRKHHPGDTSGFLDRARSGLECRFASGRSGKSVMTARDLLHHRADALGLLKCVFHHLLQVNAIAGILRNLVAVLLDLAHVEQQRGQWPVELARDRGSGFIHRTVACGGKPDHFKIIVGGRGADPLLYEG